MVCIIPKAGGTAHTEPCGSQGHRRAPQECSRPTELAPGRWHANALSQEQERQPSDQGRKRTGKLLGAGGGRVCCAGQLSRHQFAPSMTMFKVKVRSRTTGGIARPPVASSTQRTVLQMRKRAQKMVTLTVQTAATKRSCSFWTFV